MTGSNWSKAKRESVINGQLRRLARRDFGHLETADLIRGHAAGDYQVVSPEEKDLLARCKQSIRDRSRGA